jgi:2-hydroxychromene-2-carboxylate isomerase
LPTPFPQNGLKAARLALIGFDEGWGAAFTRAVFTAQFSQAADIADGTTLDRILQSLAIEPGAVHVRSNEVSNKERLKRDTETAQALGLFGAPSFTTTDGELFWGDDRLEAALSWAAAL